MPIRVGLSDTFRFTFTGALAAGVYTVTFFVAGSFSDSAGVVNQAETETFTVEPSRPRRSSTRRLARRSTARS